jgi:hypothetical protein
MVWVSERKALLDLLCYQPLTAFDAVAKKWRTIGGIPSVALQGNAVCGGMEIAVQRCRQFFVVFA